jgi:fructoselysine 6-kinase
MKIACIGDCGIDYYLPSGPLVCGGITANFALQARAVFPAGDAITVISATGNDDGAALVGKRFENSGVDCRIARLDGTSSVQYIEIEPDGEKNFLRYDEGVLRGFRLSDRDRDIVASSDLRVMPVFQQVRDFFEEVIAIDNAGLTTVDFADFADCPDFSLLESHAHSVDVGFFGLSPGQEDLIRRVAGFALEYDKLMVVTLGAGGSRAFRGSEAFGADVGASLERGAALAADVIQRIGAN